MVTPMTPTPNADYGAGDLIDVTDAIACDYCRAAPGIPCHTKNGLRLPTRTHACRIVWFPLPPRVRAGDIEVT